MGAFIGIDPGNAKLGFAVLSEEGDLVFVDSICVWKPKELLRISDICADSKAILVGVEDIAFGVSAARNQINRSSGIPLYPLILAGLTKKQVKLYGPSSWRATFWNPKRRLNWKKEAKKMYTRLWGTRPPDDNAAEAALIAEHCRREYKRKERRDQWKKQTCR